MFRCECGGSLSTDFIDMEKTSIYSTQVVLVHEVPCTKCSECGETYFKYSVLNIIEEVVAEVLRKGGINEEETAYFNIFTWEEMQDFYYSKEINYFEKD